MFLPLREQRVEPRLVPVRAVDVLDEVHRASRVAVLVIVPGDELVASRGHREGRARVEDARRAVPHEVGGHSGFGLDSDDASHRARGGVLDRGFHSLERGVDAQIDREVNRRRRRHRYAQRVRLDFAAEAGQNLRKRLRRAGRGGHDVLHAPASPRPVLFAVAVHARLRDG